jgi:hypothetical protein
MAHRPLNLRKLALAASLVLALCWTPALCPAASPAKLTGSLLGSVKDSAGVPQMGATVLLFNRYDRIVQKAVTNLRGDFLFDALPSDVYSIRVTLNSFVPALKKNILVQPGMQSVLAINLASLLSSIELVYTAPATGPLMSDEWKWMLRGSMSTRPVLRIMPELERRTRMEVFSDTAGMLRVSAGDGAPGSSSYGTYSDLGTAFALATSVFGSNRVQVSGNFGYGIDTASPTTGVRASYSRNAGMTEAAQGPEVSVTMQQAALPVRGGALIGGRNGNAPALSTMAVSFIDRQQIGEGIQLEYGASMESVTFFDRLNFVSPFARASWEIYENGKLAVGYSSGAPPIELLLDGRDVQSGLQQDLLAVSMLPRVSLRGGRAHVQRNENLEIGYEWRAGGRIVSLGAYREMVRNGAVTLGGPDGFSFSGFEADLLPELASSSSVFNVGRYRRYGYSAAVTQELGDLYALTVAYGNGGVLGTSHEELLTDSPDELRSLMRMRQQHWVSGRVAGTLPGSGTRFNASYQWSGVRALTPVHVYFTQQTVVDAGLNLRVRQPLPRMPGMPGRLEATAEVRNLLAQGYLPISTSTGRRMILTHSPRGMRGGVSLIF